MINSHAEEVIHHIPTPKAMHKATVSEAIAASWVGLHRGRVDAEADEGQGMFFELSGGRRKTDPLVYNKTRGKKAVALKKIKGDVANMASQLSSMDETTKKLLDVEAKAHDLVEEPAEKGHVINDNTECCRRVAFQRAPPVDWMAVCTFRFGLVRHRMVAEPPATGYKQLCHRCLPQLREARKRAPLESSS